MKPLRMQSPRPSFARAFVLLCAAGTWLLCGTIVTLDAQEAVAQPGAAATAQTISTNATPAPGATVAGTNAVPANADATRASSDTNASPDEIQLSFQNTPIDMIVQWLMQTTGKSVMKNQQVQGQITITSSKKIPKRQAIDLVYRALALEGFSATESATYIAITREGQEPKTSPELVDTGIPEGRQRLVKIFPLEHAQAGDLRDRIRVVLSDKATVDVDDRGNQLIVTDYNDNLRMLAELIKDLDVTTTSDFTLKIYPLKFAEAEEIGNLISMILNAQSPPPSQPGRPSSSSGSSPRLPPGISSVSVIGGSSDSSSSSSPGGGSGTASGPPTQQVRIWPDKVNNRLIVSAPRSKLVEVDRLVTTLDTNKPEDVAVRVLPIKHMAALDLMRELTPLYQKMSGKSLKDMIEVSADDQSNSLIVLSSEVNFRAIEKLVSSLDTEDAQDKIMKTFTLKNADAEDIAKQLQDLNQDSQNTRYYVMYTSGQQGRSKKMNIVADRRRNAVIVQAPPAQMDGIEKMIDELDQPVQDESLAPKIYHLKYVSATDVEDVLNELFLKKQQQRSYYDLIYDEIYGPQSSSQGEGNVGRLYGKVRITSEPYSNTLIITSNSRENLAVVENIINQLDSPSEAGESTARVPLKYAKAPMMAKYLNILFAKNGSPQLQPNRQQPQQQGTGLLQQQQGQNNNDQYGFNLEQEMQEEGYYPWIGGPPDQSRTTDGRGANRPISDLIDRVRVVPDQPGNALVISANVHLFPSIMKLINDLDVPADQVLIEARVVEVGSDFLDKLGVRWSPDGSKVYTSDDFDDSILAHAMAVYQQGFGGNTMVNTPSSSTVAQALTSLRSGVLSSMINMDFLVQFLRKTVDATVLDAPQIAVRDNETGKLFVGQEVPRPDNTQVNQLGGQNTAITYKPAGVRLEVTPHINASGDVQMKAHVESSALDPQLTVLGNPVFNTRQFRTDLTIRNGETMVLGGIIQKQISNAIRKFPVIGNIPGLGWAFKKKDQSTREVELMVFLRPKVVHTVQDAQDLMREINNKAPRLQEWQEESQPMDPHTKEPATKYHFDETLIHTP